MCHRQMNERHSCNQQTHRTEIMNSFLFFRWDFFLSMDSLHWLSNGVVLSAMKSSIVTQYGHKNTNFAYFSPAISISCVVARFFNEMSSWTYEFHVFHLFLRNYHRRMSSYYINFIFFSLTSSPFTSLAYIYARLL